MRIVEVTLICALFLVACTTDQKAAPTEDAGAGKGDAVVAAENPTEPGTERAAAPELPESPPPVRLAAAPVDEALVATASVLDVNVGAWRSEPRGGNFAQLSVTIEQGQSEPLAVQMLDVRVAVVGRMARTEVTQVFVNHLHRQTEGTYVFQLPAGASISRLAMDVDGKLMEGELVERERARQIYESIVRKQKDPALLEWQGGNRFKTQIFPIPAGGTKTVVLAYDQLLPETRDGLLYRYALPRLDAATAQHIGDFTFAMTAQTARSVAPEGYPAHVDDVAGGKQVTLRYRDFVPAGPVDVRFGAVERREPVVAQGHRVVDGERQDFFLVDTAPDVPALSDATQRDLVVAVDTSAGIGAPVLEQTLVAALMLIGQQPAGTRFHLVHGDLDVAVCTSQPMQTSDSSGVVECMKQITAGGATDLGALLQRSLELARSLGGPVSVVVFTDGVASIGELDGDMLRAQVSAAASDTKLALHTVGIGHNAADGDLSALATAGRGHFVRMTPDDSPSALVAELQQRVREPLLLGVRAEVVDGQVDALTPTEPTNVSRGESVAILGRLRSDRATLRLSGSFEGQPFSQEVLVARDAAAPESPLLSNFWARAAIGEMQAKAAPRADVVAMSMKYGVMSPFTSFLVLDNDAAYEQFQVERRKEAEKKRAETQTATSTDSGIDGDTAAAANLQKSDQNLSELLEAAAQNPQQAPGSALEGRFSIEGANDQPALALAQDSEEEDAVGNYGLGLSGEGRGGGGRSAGGFGIGNFGTGGHGGRNYGRAAAALGDQQSAKAALTFGTPTVSGALDVRIIRKVSQQHANELRHCYSRYLHDDLGLGAVTVKWTIDETGQVVSAVVTSTSINNRNVEACVADSVRHWRFPTPRGGGIVVVSASFRFGNLDLSPEAVIEQLADKDDLSLDEHVRLMEAYLAMKRLDEADAHFKKRWLPFAKTLSAVERLVLLANDDIQKRYPAAYASAARDALEEGASDVAVPLARHMLANGEADQLVSALGSVTVSPEEAYAILVATSEAYLEVATQLFDGWRQSFSSDDVLVVLNHERLWGARPEVAYQAAVTELQGGEAADSPTLLPVLTGAAAKLDKQGEAIALLQERCFPEFGRDRCVDAIRSFGAHPDVEPVLARLFDTSIATIHTARASDMGNTALILDQASLLEQFGRADEGRRVLSELVEFAPHDSGQRSLYANALQKRGDLEGACRSYAAVAQLDPSERDVFRTLMDMRRGEPDRAELVKRCIVDGVSDLPVRRDLSLVMTWEDEEADVDLHIVEATGEEVWYRHRESASGGLLYYDITNGFGPEIYVLGGAPRGKYELSVVYYRGNREKLRGTVTVMENAGSPDETRREFPFVLSHEDSDRKVPLTTLTLD